MLHCIWILLTSKKGKEHVQQHRWTSKSYWVKGMGEHFISYLFEYALSNNHHNSVIGEGCYNTEGEKSRHTDKHTEKSAEIGWAAQKHRCDVSVDELLKEKWGVHIGNTRKENADHNTAEKGYVLLAHIWEDSLYYLRVKLHSVDFHRYSAVTVRRHLRGHHRISGIQENTTKCRWNPPADRGNGSVANTPSY